MKTKTAKPPKILLTPLHTYAIEAKLYRRLIRHSRIPSGCSNGKLYPLPSNTKDFHVCLKCGRHVNNELLKHYKVEIPQDVPNLKELRIVK